MRKSSFRERLSWDVGACTRGVSDPLVQGAGSGGAPKRGVAHAPTTILRVLRPAKRTAQSAVRIESLATRNGFRKNRLPEGA